MEEKVVLGPVIIASFVFQVLLNDEGRRVSPRFHLFFSDINRGIEEKSEFKIVLIASAKSRSARPR